MNPSSTPSSTFRRLANEIVRRLQEAGHESYLVGGCVRDALLGREPTDYDIASSATPDRVEALFPKTIPVGRKFGVVLVVMEHEQFQVATFRAESDYQDGRRPEQISFGDPRADAMRRDFTINGLFYDPIRNQVHDWVGGEADLRTKILRTIGSPEERFAEDHLRLLRAVRFAAQLNFQIEATTFAAVRANAATIRGISAERIRDELTKLLRPPHASRGLELLRESGLLAEVLPEIAATEGCEQSPEFHPEGSVFNHIRLMFEHMPADAPEMLPWAVLLHDVAKPVTATRDADGRIHFYEHERVGETMAIAIMERLRFTRKQIDAVAACVRNHMRFNNAPKMRKSTLRRLLMRETYPLELALNRLDSLGSCQQLEVHDFLVAAAEDLARQPQVVPPLVNGDDLIALGAKSGPALGALLAEIREKQLLDELETAEQALDWARGRLQAQ